MSVHPDQILYIQANDNYSKIVTTLNITFTVRTTLKEIQCLMARVSDTKFTRVHSSYIIRLAGLTFDKTLTEVTLSNGHRIPVSRAFRKDLQAELLFL